MLALLTLYTSYLEMAMNGPLDKETQENLQKSHAASKVCNYVGSHNKRF